MFTTDLGTAAKHQVIWQPLLSFCKCVAFACNRWFFCTTASASLSSNSCPKGLRAAWLCPQASCTNKISCFTKINKTRQRVEATHPVATMNIHFVASQCHTLLGVLGIATHDCCKSVLLSNTSGDSEFERRSMREEQPITIQYQ